MPLKTHAFRTSLCIIIVLSFIISALVSPVCFAQPDGETKLYFTGSSSVYGLDFDSLGGFPLLSEIPPTDENASYYPPKIIQGIPFLDGVSFNNETLLQWAISWAFVLFENLDPEEFEELFGLSKEYLDFFDQLGILLPHPLRTTQSYQYTGNESINLNGNIDYDLYFRTKPASQLNKNDQVQLSVYTYSESSPFPTLIGNTTFSITPGYFQKTIQQSVTITNISKTIKPNQYLLFSVELLPGEKYLSRLITRENPLLRDVTQFVINATRTIANAADLTTINEAFAFFDELETLMTEENINITISKDDIADIAEAVISLSFVYDSTDFPSSVTVPLKAAGSNEDSSITQYLHTNNQLKTTKPIGTVQQTVNLVSTPGSWKASSLPRNKIISDASAIIYISHKDMQRLSDQMVVNAELTYGNTTLDSDSVTLEKTNLFSTSLKPYRFTFDDLNTAQELSYGSEIGLRVSLNDADAADNFFRSAEIYYAASEYMSFLTYTLSETDHIQATTSRNPSDGHIIIGDTVNYTLDITSDLQDTISVNVQTDSFSADEQEFWDVDISPESFSINNNGNKTVIVALTSLGTTLNAYEQAPLDITLSISGNTGYDTAQLSAEVSEKAVTYDTIITVPKDREVVHGTNTSFTFTIENNNTGLWEDSFIFSASADKNISLTYFPNTFDNLGVGNQTNVTVNVSIPEKTEIDEVTITLKVKSKQETGIDRDVTVNITVIGANIFENAYDYFEKLSETLGLTEVFGEFAAIILVSIIFIVVFFILIIMAFILTNKYVKIICIDRIKQITPGNSATYEITLENTTNKMRTYHIHSNLPEKSSSWNITFSKNQLTIPAKQQQTLTATVSASDQVNPGDWNEFQLIVTTDGKSKQETLSLFCSLADGTVSLQIKDVFHWPKSFSKNEKVSTSLRVYNNGTVQAKNVAVKLFINNKEKNKVEELIIPAGGHADITLPWIAEKGKNDLRILVS